MSAMNFPSNPSNGDIYHKWEYDASAGKWSLIVIEQAGTELSVTYSLSPPSTVPDNVGDEHYITSDGTANGDVSDGYVWNGISWTNQLYRIDGSSSTNDF